MSNPNTPRGFITTNDGRRISARLLDVLQNRLSRDQHMDEAEEPISQRQSKRKGNQTAKARKPKESKGVTKKRMKPATLPVLPVVFDRYRDTKVEFDPDARPEPSSRLAPGALSRQLYQLPLTDSEKAQKEQRKADARKFEIQLARDLDEMGVGNITAAATRSAEATKDLDDLFKGLNLKKAEGRRRRRRRRSQGE